LAGQIPANSPNLLLDGRVVELMNMLSLEESVRKHLKFNITVNLLDGAFYGLGWGFGSVGTIVTLFVSRMTNSAILIGLIPAIHAVGWQLPQLFMANRVSRLRRYKPMVMWMTIHERLPFLGLALVALFMTALGNKTALGLTFMILIWQGLGAGFTANGWQSMIAKIIPSDWRGTFFGAQAAWAMCSSVWPPSQLGSSWTKSTTRLILPSASP
jgi:hypothetical protein